MPGITITGFFPCAEAVTPANSKREMQPAAHSSKLPADSNFEEIFNPLFFKSCS